MRRKTRAGDARKSIHVFDLDDTLITTSAKVRVLDALGRELRALTPSEFTTHALGAGEAFDFGDFANAGLLAKGVVLKYTRTIIETLKRRGTRSDFGILTARGDKHLHAPFLIRLFDSLFGIPLKKSLIFNLSDTRFMKYKDAAEMPEPFRGRRYAHLTIPERKALVIAQELVGRGYNDISLYDDSRENLRSFQVIRHAFPRAAYHPHFIDPTWRVRLEEFLASDQASKVLTQGAESAAIILESHSRWGSESGLKALEAKGRLELNMPGLALEKAASKYYLVKDRGTATPLRG